VEEEILTHRIPCSQCLFKTMEGLVKLTNMVWELRISEAKRLRHIDVLRDGVVKEHIVNVHLAEGPLLG